MLAAGVELEHLPLLGIVWRAGGICFNPQFVQQQQHH
jgi:hypothetical protein